MTNANKIFSNFATLVGKDIKKINAAIGDPTQLKTNAKTIVVSINELFEKISSATQGIDDARLEGAIRDLKNELLGGAVSDQLDTLKELGEKLTALEGDSTIKAAILNKFTEIRQELTTLKSELDNFTATDLVAVYNQAKQGA